jgi:type III pantothenate kinase
MKFLIGDIGNTSTKICVLNNNFKILRSYNFETIKILKDNLLNTIIRKRVNKDLSPNFLFSSVVPKVFLNIKKSLNVTKYKVLELKNLNLNKVIKINVKNKKQLGSDRIANAIGIKKLKIV